ncbi:MAG: hypothetical protein Q9208_005009 [Pyrenodesmia sp. 3 TL-2023]
MPTFYARGVNVRLSVANIARSTTSAPLNTLCQASSDNADRASKQLEHDAENGGTLAESPLWLDKDDCRLRFLGEQQHMPFLMVYASSKYPFSTIASTRTAKTKQNPLPLRLNAGGSIVDTNGSPLTSVSSSPLSPVPTIDDSNDIDLSTTEPPQAADTGTSISRPVHEPPQPRPAHTEGLTFCTEAPRPQALCLRVLPSAMSFLRTRDAGDLREVVNDIKIDVYLNGDLCASAYVPERAFHGKGYARNTFSGMRNHRLTEVPWILEPPGSNVTETPIEPAHAAQQANSRWAEISNGLISAAESNGRNNQNQLSMVGEYLQSLAAIPMPVELPGKLKGSPKRFAVIDVVVTTGKGSKDGPSGTYLFRSIPLKLHGFGVHEEPSSAKVPEGRTKQQQPAKNSSGRAKRSHPPPPQQVTPLGLPTPPPMHISTTTTPIPTIQTGPQAHPSKKRKIHYYDVLDTRQTMAEEMEDIANQAADKDAIYFTERRVTRSKLADTVRVDAPAIDISTLKPTGSSRPSKPFQPPAPINRADSSSPEKPLILRHRTVSHNPLASRGPSTPQPRAIDTTSLGTSSRKSNGARVNDPVPWEIPASSRDCVVTYARDGTERQIRAERGGRFKEEGVLIGVRYVVG